MRDENKRELILETAKNLFSLKGFHSTSIPDIVNESGLSTGAIYTYFKNKEEIMLTIIDEGWAEFSEHIRSTVERYEGFDERFDAFLTGFLNELERSSNLANIMITEGIRFEKARDLLHIFMSHLISLVGLPKEEDGFGGSSETAIIETGIIIIVLGIIDTLRMSSAGPLSIDAKRIKTFVKALIDRIYPVSSR